LSRYAVPDIVKVSFLLPQEAAVPRTPGAKNRTARELRADAARLTEKAKYLDKIEKLKKEAQKKK